MASRVTVEEVRKWTEIVALVMPTGVQGATLAVQAVAALIRAVRGVRGEPASADDPEDLVLAGEVVAMLTAAQAPWIRIRQRAEAELARTSGG